MQVHHRACRAAHIVKRAVQGHFLGRGIAIDQDAVCIEPGQPARIQPSETRARGRHQQAPVLGLGRNVAGAAAGQAAIEHRLGQQADLFAKARFGAHARPRTFWAKEKKSSDPKLPDFSVRATSWPALEQ